MTKPTKWLCAQRRQISLGVCPVWSESSLSAWIKRGPLATYWAHSEYSDQTGRMPRLIWVCAGRTAILLVLSCRGSFCSRHFFKKQNKNNNGDVCLFYPHVLAMGLAQNISYHIIFLKCIIDYKHIILKLNGNDCLGYVLTVWCWRSCWKIECSVYSWVSIVSHSSAGKTRSTKRTYS